MKTCCNCGRGPEACSWYDKTCQLESSWYPAGKWPSLEQRTGKPNDDGIGNLGWIPPPAKLKETATSELNLQCVGGPKDGKVVTFRGMAYQCCTMGHATDENPLGFVKHTYIPEVAAGGYMFLAYNGEVGAGQKPARKGSKMRTTRVAYVLCQREKHDAGGNVVREEKILRPEKAEEGFAYIDVASLNGNKVREAVLEKEHEFITELGLTFADVEVVHPFQGSQGGPR